MAPERGRATGPSVNTIDEQDRSWGSVFATGRLLAVALLFGATYASRQYGGIDGSALRVLDDVLIGVAVVLSFRVARMPHRATGIHAAVAIVAVSASITADIVQSEAIARLADVLSSYLVLAAAAVVFRFVVLQRRVSADTVAGAVAVYLAIGVLFGIIFTAIARANPAAFDPPQVVRDGQSEVYYFSFVTLTSLGYGDISPVADEVRILATMEAVCGAILLATLVGRIVGLSIAQASDERLEARVEAIKGGIARIEDAVGRPSGDAAEGPTEDLH